MTTPSERKAENDRKRLEKAYAVHSSGCWKRLDLARFADLLDSGAEVIECEWCGEPLYDASLQDGYRATREEVDEAGIDHSDMSISEARELLG